MNTMLTTTILTIIFFAKMSMAQVIGSERIGDSGVTPWVTEMTEEYQSVYHFGYSEMESDLILLFCNDKIYGQIKSGAFSDVGDTWIWTYTNLTNIKIENNYFYSDQTNGEFVIYDNGEEKTKGLKVYNPWSGLTEKGEYEIGTKSYPINDYFYGRYTQASKRLLSREELNNLPKRELKFIRSEIYARYGYKFLPGEEIEEYFKKQDWYFGQYENVNDFITDIEKENIKLIQQIENE